MHEPEVGARPPFCSKGLVGMEVETLVRPAVEGAGLELVEAVFRRESGRQVLRVVVDREGGVDLDTVAAVSEKLSRRLDLEDFGKGRYALEVSTPGIERPLRTSSQFQRVLGSTVKVKTAELVDGTRVHQGLLVAADEEAIVVEVDGERRRLVLTGVTSAHTVVDWAAELKGSKA